MRLRSAGPRSSRGPASLPVGAVGDLPRGADARVRRPLAAVLAALCLSAATVGPLVAQDKKRPDTIPRQAIAFEFTEPGRPSVVSPKDPGRAGQWEIRGTPGAIVRLEFTLPVRMTGEDGTVIPIVFGPDDAAMATVPAPSAAMPFDPRTVRNAPLGSQDGRLFVFIGGRASPPPGARPSRYDATILLTVTYVDP